MTGIWCCTVEDLKLLLQNKTSSVMLAEASSKLATSSAGDASPTALELELSKRTL